MIIGEIFLKNTFLKCATQTQSQSPNFFDFLQNSDKITQGDFFSSSGIALSTDSDYEFIREEYRDIFKQVSQTEKLIFCIYQKKEDIAGDYMEITKAQDGVYAIKTIEDPTKKHQIKAAFTSKKAKYVVKESVVNSTQQYASLDNLLKNNNVTTSNDSNKQTKTENNNNKFVWFSLAALCLFPMFQLSSLALSMIE